MRYFAIVFGIPLLAAGQIQDLATTGDGGQTYFSTQYRQKGTDQPGYLKIFRVAEHGLELFRQLTFSSLYPGGDSDFYLATRPSLSADGHVVGYTASRTCMGGSHCIGFIYDEAWFAGEKDRSPGLGKLSVSPDGHSFLTLDYRNIGPSQLTVGDLESGNAIALDGYGPIGDGRQLLANGPVALLSSGGNPVLWKAGQVTQLSFTALATHARVNAAGDVIVYESWPVGGNYELHSYSPALGRDTLLATGGPPLAEYQPNSYFHPWLTFDGQYVSYVLNGRLLVQPTGGSEARTLTSAEDGTVVDQVISGFGNVAFAATDAGRLLRIDVATGAKTELIAAVPHLEVAGGAQVPGGRLDVAVADPAAGDPRLAGADAPIVGRSGNTVTLQVPWEAVPESTVRLYVPANPSAFEEVHDLTLWAGQPWFYTLPSPPNVYPQFALAAHQDFSGTVTVDSPARPGEVVHLYLTGLGAVAPSIATGATTPVGTLYRLQTPLTCLFRQDAQEFPADVLFVGLAPGMVGVEQMDVRVPASATAPALQIDCESGQSVGTISGYAQLPVSP